MRYTNKDKIEIIKNRNQVEFFFGGGGGVYFKFSIYCDYLII